RGRGQGAHRARRRAGRRRQAPRRQLDPRHRRAPRARGRCSLRQRRRPGPHGRALRRGRGGGRAVALRGVLAAGRRGHGRGRAPRGHNRRRPARGRGRGRPQRPARPAGRPRRPRRRHRPGARRPRAADASRRRRPGPRPRPLHVGGHGSGHRRAVPPGHPGAGAQGLMLTVDFERLGVRAGDRLLDLGCGGGRHAFEAHRRGARVVALDRDWDELEGAAAILEGMNEAGEGPVGSRGGVVRGDALTVPFPDGAFDRVIAAEILEHIPTDTAAIAELVRVLRPGGTMAVTVPRWLPERICWALSDDYHSNEGGHIRIYRAGQLAARLRAAGLLVTGSHHAHALHSPYWWLKCAAGVHNDRAPLVGLYHRFLVRDITNPTAAVRRLERVLDPLIGKSLVLYATRPATVRAPIDEPARAAA